MKTENEILDCGHAPSPHSDFTTGYGENEKGEKHCYACCAEQDKAYMREQGKIVLYLTIKDGKAKVSNWPGSLVFSSESGTRMRYRTGGHNFTGTRYDVWFTFEGQKWHGVRYGDMTEVCHCKRIKG